MAFDKEQRAALEILESIENGTTSAAGSFHLLEHADPTLIYFIFEWLKQSYAGHPAAEGVHGRLAALCTVGILCPEKPDPQVVPGTW